MPHHMLTDELKKLKRGDQVFIGGKYRTIISKGPKWAYLEGMEQPIDIAKAELRSTGFGCGNRLNIYRTETTYNLAQEQARKAQFVASALNRINYGTVPGYLVDDLYDVFKRHGIIKPVNTGVARSNGEKE